MKSTSPVRDQTIPKVARRLGLHEQQLRRVVKRGEIKTATWNGRVWIAPDEEKRVKKMMRMLDSKRKK